MTSFIRALTRTQAGVGITILRVVTGIIFMAHGSQKLFAWFGGPGLEGVGQWMESLGITPGVPMAALAGSAEFFGGLALIVGLLVRPAALAVGFTMVVAIFTAHIANGFFMSNGGYEYALALLVISVALLFEGAGRCSLDRLIAGSK